MYIGGMELLLEQKGETDISEIASRILDTASITGHKPSDRNATTIFLQGNLGAGKTTLTQEIARHLGISESITSPTFVILKQYKIANDKFKECFDRLIHIDLYRLEGDEEYIKNELNLLKIPDVLKDSRNLIIIEWPERLHDILVSDISVVIESVGENARNYKITSI